ncbi:MAG: hypothetical protein Q9214_004670 [Letrouitia sp. 1 TL-2023]
MNALIGCRTTTRDLAPVPLYTNPLISTKVKAIGGLPIEVRPQFRYIGNGQSLYFLDIAIPLFFDCSGSGKYAFERVAHHASEFENLRIAWESRSISKEMMHALERVARYPLLGNQRGLGGTGGGGGLGKQDGEGVPHHRLAFCTTYNMLFHQVLDIFLPIRLSNIILIILASILSLFLYRIFLHPLSNVPGPLLAKGTSWWHHYHTYIGDECTAIHACHLKYGSLVRIGPNDVDIADGTALSVIYNEKGGFRKAQHYANFNVDGFNTIFTARDPSERALRAKAVAPLFSSASIRAKIELLYECVARFVKGIEEEKGQRSPNPIDIQEHARFLSMDIISSYLFGQRYQESESSRDKLTAAPWLDFLVVLGRFFYLPSKICSFCLNVDGLIRPSKKFEEHSTSAVQTFLWALIDKAKENTFHGDLIAAGIPESEAKAQSEDIMFAGSHTTGMTLATILWHLCEQPEVYSNLRNEIVKNIGNRSDPQQLPYLKGVIKEGLRLSKANPTRLARVAPKGGWTFDGRFFPAGTTVGLGAFEMHSNTEVFEEANAFRPERWLNPSPKMNRDYVPFGTGLRQCIARNLATTELFLAVEKVVEADVLSGAKHVADTLEVNEWFNAQIKGGKVELVWSSMK